jgi:hypothetical protein
MTPDKARQALQHLLEKAAKEPLTPGEQGMINILQRLAFADIPPIQHWVLSSAGPPTNGWTEAKWKKLHKQLPSLTSNIKVALYRGTKFPWIEAGKKKLKNLTEIKAAIKSFDDKFANKKLIKVQGIMPFTKAREIAERFATEAKGYKMEEGYTFDNGFIHIIKAAPGLKGVDVAAEVVKVHKNIFNDHDERQVSKKEKEVLIIPGTTLRPVSKEGRVYTWEFVVPRATRTRKQAKTK